MTVIPMQRPHSDKQYQLITYPGNVASLCGRRWGKTDGYVQRIYYHAQRNPGLYWWVGLSWQSASMKRAWKAVTYTANKVYYELGLDPRKYINRSRHEVIIPGLGEIWFRTADNPSSLAGEGIKGAVFDEFSLAQEIVWTEYLQATLLDHKGWIGFGGVPKGLNWAASLWKNAAEWDGWLQIHATTYENPIIDHKELDKIKATLPEDLFAQEYMAKIVNLQGSVFRRVQEAAVLEQSEPVEGRQYMAGVDVAALVDYTVVTVIDVKSKEMVYMDRFNRVDYPVLEDRLAAVYDKWHLQSMTIEANSIGQPVIDHMINRGYFVIPFTTTNATKQAAIQGLQSAFEHAGIKIINDPVLMGELLSFQSKRNPSGSFSYSAPSGMHDDCVMSLAIAWHGVSDTNQWAVY